MEGFAITLATGDHLSQRVSAFDVIVLESIHHLIATIETGQDVEGVAAVPAEDQAKIGIHMDDRTEFLNRFDDGVAVFLHVGLSF